MKSEENNYKKRFCDKYFGKNGWQQDVLNKVDVLLIGRHGAKLLYIEFKYIIKNETDRRRALAQAILTNKKQEQILSRCAVAYMDAEGCDVLELIDCSENDIMYNNDINWNAEVASNPIRDAIDRINDRLRKVTSYKGSDIKSLWLSLKNGEGTEIQITDRNFNVVYEQWRAAVRFSPEVRDEQELINCFLADILNGMKYRRKVVMQVGGKNMESEEPLIREGTNLDRYEVKPQNDGQIWFVYDTREIKAVRNTDDYHTFWRKYHRPPQYAEFLKILEHSNRLYTEKYRRDTGGEYTPTCFVELQNAILARLGINLGEYIVCDPCAGVGNLENQFGREYKQYCYLSTLEQMDVDICKKKDFENVIQFDYLATPAQPQWKYKGEALDIREIARHEGRKLMVVMNPPYTRHKGFKNDLAIEFFNKVTELQPDVIVYYCKTEFFLRPSVSNFASSGYRIMSHVFSNAKTTFRLSEWAVSQVVFSRTEGKEINPDYITADRYEISPKDDRLHFVRTYTYDNKRPNLIKEIERMIKESEGTDTMRLGQWTNQSYCVVLSDRTNLGNRITTGNLEYCLMLKGINFNTHGKYFETSNLTYRGTTAEIPAELFNDAVMFSLYYKGIMFTNKGRKNYIMPFTATELGCEKNDLNVMFPESDLFSEGQKPFDFREFLARFSFSAEARALRTAALGVFRYYHSRMEYEGKDWNDSFYDITNAIMGKDVSSFREPEGNDRRITRVKTTKGTRGFSRATYKYVVPGEYHPVFENFFDCRDTLAVKINKELLDVGLLLWQRENIY